MCGEAITFLTFFCEAVMQVENKWQDCSRTCRLPSLTPTAIGWDSWFVGLHASISGHRRRGLADGVQWVARCLIRTEPLSTARCVLRVPQGAVNTRWKGLISGQHCAAGTIQKERAGCLVSKSLKLPSASRGIIWLFSQPPKKQR